MEEYHRDSLRELRRAEVQPRPAKRRGSFLVTLLILALFAAAGFFYLKTAFPEWTKSHLSLPVFKETLGEWKDAAVAALRPEQEEVQKVVDQALAEQDEAA